MFLMPFFCFMFIALGRLEVWRGFRMHRMSTAVQHKRPGARGGSRQSGVLFCGLEPAITISAEWR